MASGASSSLNNNTNNNTNNNNSNNIDLDNDDAWIIRRRIHTIVPRSSGYRMIKPTAQAPIVFGLLCLMCLVPPAFSSSSGNAMSPGQLAGPFLWKEEPVNPANPTGYRLPQIKEFLILAPKRVRPQQTFNVYVTVAQMLGESLRVRATLTRNGEAYANGFAMFTQPSMKRIQLPVPDDINPGVHVLKVEGASISGFSLFRNETEVEYQSKHVSLFVQMEKPVYHCHLTNHFEPENGLVAVNYRVIGVYPDLTGANGAMTIYIRDSHGVNVMRMLSLQLRFGAYQGSFRISYPVNIGTWHVVVNAFGHIYEHPFEVVNWWFRRYEVNVTAPFTIFDTDAFYVGSIRGEHMLDKEAYGNATMLLRCRDTNGTFLSGEIRRDLGYMRGLEQVFYNMDDLFGVWGEALYGRELFLEGWLYDWELEETQNGTAVTKVLRDGAEIKRLGGPFTSFHPGKPFTSYFAVQRPDGSPYNSSLNRLVNVYVTHYGAGTLINEDVAVIPEDNIVRVKVVPRMDDTRITIQVIHSLSTSEDIITAYKYYSFNGMYVSLTTSTETPKTNTYSVFTVRTNFYATECYYVLAANGDLLSVETLTMYSQQKTFSVAMSRQLMPRGRVIVYCIVQGVVIMDALNFFVYDTMLTNATIEKNLGKDFRHDTIEIIGKEKKGSFIGLNGVHYDWYKRGAATFLTRVKVMDELSTYDSANQGPFQHNWHYDDPRWDGDVHFTSDTNGLDPNSTLRSSGIAVITDMRISHTLKDEIVCNASLGLGQCISRDCFPLYGLCDGVAHCLDGFDEAACPLLEPPTRKPPVLKLWSTNRHYFFKDNMWTFKTEYLKPNMDGQVELKLDVPETTEDIVFGAFFMNPDTGLTLAENIVMHDTRRRYFMKCEAPHMIKRGEQLGVRCAMFNFYHEFLETLITLHGNEGYRSIIVEESMVTSSYAPRTFSGDIQTMVYMFPGEQRYFYFPIVPTISVGDIVITVSSVNMAYSDVEELDVMVWVEGAPNPDYLAYLVDLYDKPSLLTPYFHIVIPEIFWNPQKRELLYIPESNFGIIQLWGDVVHPGYFEKVFNYDLASGFADDSADGYTFGIGYNYILMDYLKTINCLDEAVEATVVDYMKAILIRQNAYIDEEGALVMFRHNSPQVLWLTALGLSYLDDVSKSQWGEDLYISSDLRNKIAGWLVSHQNPEGAFVETDHLNHCWSFRPYTVDENGVNHTWYIPSTAQAVITLAEASRLTGDTASRVMGSVAKGAEYLAGKLVHLIDPFQLAITAYALHAAGHSSQYDAYVKLKSMRREAGGLVYWADREIVENEVIVIDNRHLMQPRMDYPNLGNAMMATSFALLLHLAHGEFESTKPIMTWIVESHMDPICFSGSVDTLWGTKALVEYAKRETNHMFYNLEVTLESTANPLWKTTVNINQSNIGQLWEWWIRPIYGEIVAHVTGTGYAHIGVYTEFNTEKSWMTYDMEDYVTFDTYIEYIHYFGRNASSMEISMCSSWLRTDWRPNSDMTLLWIEMPTGFYFDRDETERLYRTYPFIKRAHFKMDPDMRLFVFIFFDQFTTEEVCWTMRSRRWFPIANSSIAHYWMLNEYYETGIYRASSYSAFTLFHQHICQVCGSFQCPYCPWYNAASASLPSHVLFFVIIITGSILLMLSLRRPR